MEDYNISLYMARGSHVGGILLAHDHSKIRLANGHISCLTSEISASKRSLNMKQSSSST